MNLNDQYEEQKRITHLKMDRKRKLYVGILLKNRYRELEMCKA